MLSICSFAGNFRPTGCPIGWQPCFPSEDMLWGWSPVCQWPPSSVAAVAAHHPSHTHREIGFHLEASQAFSFHTESGISPDALLTAPALAPLQFPYETIPGKPFPGNF